MLRMMAPRYPRPSYAGACESNSGPCSAADRRRYRPIAIRRTRAGASRHHRLGRCAGRAPGRSVSASRREPDHHQCPSDQPRRDARSQRVGRRLLLCACRGSRDRRSPDRGVGEDANAEAFRLELHPRYPGALPYELWRCWRAFAQHRTARPLFPLNRRCENRSAHRSSLFGRNAQKAVIPPGPVVLAMRPPRLVRIGCVASRRSRTTPLPRLVLAHEPRVADHVGARIAAIFRVSLMARPSITFAAVSTPN
jgi:hypothetical protein